ncbi:MAG: M57 family metalloprotease [Eubacteriales bacterium]|nr:M57 family metalloprotease [Eubacteriales bacterium]
MKTRRILVALSLCLLVSLCNVSNAYAYNTFNQHKLTYGVGNYGKDTQHYYITSSASGYTSYINTAMSEWVNTTSSMGVTTPISYTRTTTQSSSRMDIYKVSTVNEWWGLTTLYNGSTEVNPNNSDWVWGKIQLDGDFASLSENKRLAVIAHEMGHVMGLAHSDLNNVLMRADIAYNSSSISRAQANDLAGINYLYQ